jgi:hypothetical protein
VLTVAQATSTNATVQSATTILGSPELPRFDIHPDADRSCKPGHLYSAHDIVGDPQACIMGGYSGVGNVRSTVGAVPAL